MGIVTVIPDSGALTPGIPTPGTINPAGQFDQWSFFGRGERNVTVAVNPGTGGAPSPVSPQLNWANVQLVGTTNNVLASTSSTTAGPTVTLYDIMLPVDGVYKIDIKAPEGHVASTGNYIVTAWDSTPNINPLNLNQTITSTLSTPYAVDRWNFSAIAGQSVRFDLVSTTATGISYTLSGPNGFVAFSDATSDSDLITLPESGAYALVAHSLNGAIGSYAFRLDQTSQTDLDLGTTYDGTLVGSGQAQLFRVDVPLTQFLSLKLTDPATADRIEMYARFGAPPTRAIFDHRYGAPGNNQSIFIPSAVLGTWYVLVYAEHVLESSSFSLLAAGALAKLTSIFPGSAGNAAPAIITLSGAGFVNGTDVELFASDGTTTYASSSVSIDSYTQMTASFPAGLPAGTYSVRASKDGISDTLSGAFQITAGGQANLQTQLILPTALGRRAPATLYVEYANTGDLAMPAPLLILQSTDDNNSDKPILSLDLSRTVENFWSAGLAPGAGHSVLILGSGKQPGTLHPGERIRVPVSYLGLLTPWTLSDSLIEMEIRYWTEDDTTPIDWQARKDSLRPPTLNANQWDAIYGNLTADIPTTGDYVRMLNQNAHYLGQLGQNVTSVDDLWNFEVQQAYGMSPFRVLDSVVDAYMPTPGVSLDFSRSFENTIQGRYETGPLGQGWSTPWDAKLITNDGGNLVQIVAAPSSAANILEGCSQ